MIKVQLAYAAVYYADPIVFIEFMEGFELGFVEIQELTRTAEQLSGNKPYVVLSDVRVNGRVTPMGRKVAADPNECPLHRGTAVLLKNSVLTTGANFLNKLTPSKYPIKAFTDRDKALEWLKSLPLEAAGT